MSSLSLVAPVSGVFVALEKVADPVFAEKIMGDGFAIEPSSNELIAPCDGVISQIAGALHALSLTAENGAEILLHIGLDTVHKWRHRTTVHDASHTAHRLQTKRRRKSLYSYATIFYCC